MAIAIKGADALVTYLNPTHVPKGLCTISNVAQSHFVGLSNNDLSEKQPIVSITPGPLTHKNVSIGFCASTYINHSNL